MTRRHSLRLDAIERRFAPPPITTVYVAHDVEPFGAPELVTVVEIVAGRGTSRVPTERDRLVWTRQRAHASTARRLAREESR